jgi:hypothetical protein
MNISISEAERTLARTLAATAHRGTMPQLGKRPLFVIRSNERIDNHQIVESFDLEYGEGVDRFSIVHIPQGI